MELIRPQIPSEPKQQSIVSPSVASGSSVCAYGGTIVGLTNFRDFFFVLIWDMEVSREGMEKLEKKKIHHKENYHLNTHPRENVDVTKRS